jgi:hypothetical protein
VASRPRNTTDDAGDGVVKTPDEARQGVQTFHVRWILVFSLFLAVLAIGGAYLWYVSAQPVRTAGAPAAAASASDRPNP